MTRTVLVTGASRGIGRAAALGLARDGFDVAANDLAREEAALGALEREINGMGRRCVALSADVGCKAEVQAMVAGAVSAFGQLDAVVNNAGILSTAMIDDITEEQWDAVFAINAKGVFLVTQAVLPHMKEQRRGRIVNIASIGGKLGAPGQAHYCSTKAAVLEFTRVLAMEAGPFGITANAVCPGIIDTELGRPNFRDPATIERWTALTKLGRLGVADDVTGAICFFASDASAYITGQSLNVDGGIVFD